MRRLILIAASVAPLLFATGTEAVAQLRLGLQGSGAGGFHAGAGGWRGAVRGGTGWQGGAGWRGAPRGYYPGNGYWRGGYRHRGGYPYWGWGAAGLAGAATLGALATYPAYPDYAYPDYYDGPVYPAYPAYPVYGAAPAAAGGQCSTPVKLCTLYEPAPLGIGCSCRVPGGRARGTVVGP